MKNISCLLAAATVFWACNMVTAQTPVRNQDAPTMVADIEVGVILQRLGAKMEQGVNQRQLQGYARHFQTVDRDNDGQHSKTEYIDNGNYLTPQSRRGIFNAADNDGNGFVTEPEYVLNRVITDEAKEIMQQMDKNRNGSIQQTEFVASGKLDPELSESVFNALDVDRNGSLVVPEYLRVWGQWARAGRASPAERISARKGNEMKPGLAKTLLRYDTNQDGQLEPDELLEWIRKADRNGDGALNRQELEAFEATKPPSKKRPGG